MAKIENVNVNQKYLENQLKEQKASYIDCQNEPLQIDFKRKLKI